MGLRSTFPRTHRIPDEVKAAIIAADPAIAHADLARKYGISDVSVLQFRKAGGVVLVKSKPGPKPKPATSTVKKVPGKSKFHPRERVSTSTAKAGAPMIVCSLQPSTVAVTLNFSPDQLNAIWGMFPDDVKAIAITAALQAKVEAA
ncbi:MAG: hypothetical protein ACYCOX_17775 [Acidobacteriaceae bacterium]